MKRSVPMSKYVVAVFLAVVLLFSSLSVGVRAGEKEGNGNALYEKVLKVNINDTYKAVEFNISCEREGRYASKVRTPEDKVYDADVLSAKALHCLIDEDPPQGIYTITVSLLEGEPPKDDEITVTSEEFLGEEGDPGEDEEAPLGEAPEDPKGPENSENTGTDAGGESAENGLLEASLDPIGKVTVNARGLRTYVAPTSTDIRVAREISGLKLYFKDESIVTEWTDETVGYVDVTVTNTETKQILGQASVEGKYYEVPLEEDVRQITVKVVPSRYNEVEGAGDEFILPVENYPDAVVTYEDVSLTNLKTIPVEVKLNAPYRLQFENNAQQVLERTEVLPPGQYSYDIPLGEGANALKVYVVDDHGNMRSTAHAVIRDSVSPVLEVDTDIHEAVFEEEILTVTGRVTDEESLLINGEPIEPDWEGKWTHDLTLTEGENRIEVKAVDLAGNESVYKATVTYEVPVPFPVRPVAAVTGAVIIALIAFYGAKTGRFKQLLQGKEEKDIPAKGDLQGNEG